MLRITGVLPIGRCAVLSILNGQTLDILKLFWCHRPYYIYSSSGRPHKTVEVGLGPDGL